MRCDRELVRPNRPRRPRRSALQGANDGASQTCGAIYRTCEIPLSSRHEWRDLCGVHPQKGGMAKPRLAGAPPCLFDRAVATTTTEQIPVKTRCTPSAGSNGLRAIRSVACRPARGSGTDQLSSDATFRREGGSIGGDGFGRGCPRPLFSGVPTCHHLS